MSGQKRKRHDEEIEGVPHSKRDMQSSPSMVKISLIEEDNQWNPVLASTPGLSLTTNLALKPYTKARTSASGSSHAGLELLLHSSDHPKLDYVAREESSNSSENHRSHYVGVYDPNTGRLELVRARKAVVRSTLQEARAAQEAKTPSSINYSSARLTLGSTFGTKKSQKAIHSQIANAIQPSPSKSNTQDSSEKGSQLDPVASAVVSSMADSSLSMPTREEMQAEADEGKPRPKPNLEASTPAEVYPIEQLVGGEHNLAAMGVKGWIDEVNAGKDVQLKSRFVARRLMATVKSGDVKKLKVMRYLLLLIEWSTALKPVPKRGKKVPKPEDMGTLIGTYGKDVVTGLSQRFAVGFELNKWHLDNLTTHILAIALSVDNFIIDTHDIREDLKLEGKDIPKYYAELGCAVAAPTEVEQNALGISKAERMNHRIARLKIPLSFPKIRRPPSGKGGR